MLAATKSADPKRIAAYMLLIVVLGTAAKFTFIAIDDSQSTANELSAKVKTSETASHVEHFLVAARFADFGLALFCCGLAATLATRPAAQGFSATHRIRPPPALADLLSS